MKFINKKGFTLVELLIAIAILGVITPIGYNVINGTGKTIKNQQVTTTGQLTTNIINKYLTKDLENIPQDDNRYFSKNINLNSDKISSYTYSIKTNGVSEGVDENGNAIQIKLIKYKVEINKKNNNYSVIREAYENETDTNHKSQIELISNQPIKYDKSNLPFEVLKDGSKYTVKVCYTEGDINSIGRYKNKEYVFDVQSRVMMSQSNTNTNTPENPSENPKPPSKNELPKVDLEDYTGLGFWASDYNTPALNGNNLYLWSESKGGLVDAWGNSISNESNEHSIGAHVEPGNNGNKADNTVNISGSLFNKFQSPKTDVEHIIVYACGDIDVSNLEITVEANGNTKPEKLQDIGEWQVVDSNTKRKVYDIELKKSVSKIDITGSFRITGESGYLYVVYGK